MVRRVSGARCCQVSDVRVVFTPASCTGTEIESGYRRRNRITSEEIIPNLEGNVKELYGSILCMTVVQKTRLPPVPTLKLRGGKLHYS